MTLQQIKDAADAKLASLWSAVQNKEDAYFTANNRYWQGLLTHSVIPAEGVETLPDVGTNTPAYQGSPYPVALRNVALPFALEIHQYVCPDGTKGYQAFIYVYVLGDLWTRSAQVGPETWRGYAWTKLVPAG